MFGFEKKEYNKKDYDEAESKYSEATEKLKRCLFNSESLEEAKEKLSREYQWYTQDVKDYINELCRDLAE
ncbi:MAG: hypothetical protein NTV48_02185, partial [Candidatus Vogelbacteria bacterium]|nr:hypothetical protein [Candidatus Vogelbacteria bacterium]